MSLTPERACDCALRAATPADAGGIAELVRSASAPFVVSPADAAPFYESVSEAATRRNIAADNFAWVIAESGGALAGVAALRDRSHLYHLFVAPAWQRRGLGRRLWEHLREQALLAGHSGELTVNASVNAIPVYERFGFVADGARVETHGVAFVPMRWRPAPPQREGD